MKQRNRNSTIIRRTSGIAKVIEKNKMSSNEKYLDEDIFDLQRTLSVIIRLFLRTKG